MNGLLLQPGRDEEGLHSPGSHRVIGCAAISLSSRAASSSHVTEQHPFTRLPHAMRLRVFDEAHTETSKFLNWLHAVGEPKHGFCNKLRRVIRLNAFNVGLGSFASQRPTCFATEDRAERASDDSAWASRLGSAPRLSAKAQADMRKGDF